ncbi:MAG: caspase family protein [Archangium sp.]|nr:caspase family protein [Archangium sp.]MDP3570664.1 caspase family protein [Archangium sp.]
MARFLLLCVLFASVAHAERRFALLVGANDGWATDRSLRYAHDDARRVQEVLVQLGNVAEADTTLLYEPTTRELDAALTKIEAQLAASTEPTLLFFFYSGHADASAFHLRGPVLALTTLADRLSNTKAGLTLAVVDACRSGAILGTKGAMPVAAVRLLADEPVQGFALLSSSGADELAQESKALAGSIFTHHWVSALRGAGDVDGDGTVSLTEAYGYAYDRTRIDTEASALPQRPGFRFSLKGRGDVPLTRLITAAATLELEAEPSHRYVVVDAAEQHLVAEARSDPTERRRLQLSAGSYRIKRPVLDGVLVAEVTMVPGTVLWASRLDYKKEPLEAGLVKGSSAFAEWAASGTLAQGDVNAALDMFQRMLDEDPYETRARRGKARALLVRSTELQREGKTAEEQKVLEEALSLDPTFGEDPSVARFAERAKVLKFENARQTALKKALADEILNDPRLTKHWGITFALLSTKGILVLEGHWMPTPWLFITLGVDFIGPGIDLSARWVPLASLWSPYIGGGAHYGFDAWQRKSNSTITINGMPAALSYDDIWGKMFHGDLGIQFMAPGGFTAEFGGGPMLYYSDRKQAFDWFGFIHLGLGVFFR